MAVITGFYANLTRSVKLIPWPGGHEVLFAATSDRLPSHPTKDGRATDSCFALIGAHQCGILMVDDDCYIWTSCTVCIASVTQPTLPNS